MKLYYLLHSPFTFNHNGCIQSIAVELLQMTFLYLFVIGARCAGNVHVDLRFAGVVTQIVPADMLCL